MDWREMISDFNGLVAEIVRRSSRHKTADLLAHHKKTINGWLNGALPSDAKDVAWVIRLGIQNGIDLSRFQSFAPIYSFSPMLSYEEKTQKEPPDLSWLITTQPPPSVPFNFCGIELDSPLGISSSPLMADEKWAGLMLNLRYGLSTFKTRRHTPKQSWRPPQIAFVQEPPDLINYDPAAPPNVLVTFDRKESEGAIPNIVNSIGVPSEAAWQEVYERIKRHHRGHYVGISVMGDGKTLKDIVANYEKAVKMAKELSPPFIEINPSCPNLENGLDVCDNPPLLRQICQRARKVLTGTSILLVVKLPYLPYAKMRELLKGVGQLVDAIAFRNTIRVRPIARDPNGKTYPAFSPREFGGLSGPCTFEMTLRSLKELLRIRTELKQNFGVIAIGGVATAAHVIEFLNAGADIVQACTAPMFDSLLAWKVRFHIKQFENQNINEHRLPLMSPRDQAEVESLANAYEAVSEIQRRYPERAIPYEVLRAKWNLWMEQRPSEPIGKAHRIPPARSFAEWIREFTS